MTILASAPLVISTEAKRSGEISPSDGTGGITDRRSLDSEYHGSGSCLSPITACSPARDDDGSRRPSRHFDRSGAEWRNLTPKCGKPLVAGDLSTLRFNRDEYLSLITTGSPARDDDSGRQHTVISKRDTNRKNAAPHTSFRPQRSGVEKSHSLMVHRTLGLEISRL